MSNITAFVSLLQSVTTAAEPVLKVHLVDKLTTAESDIIFDMLTFGELSKIYGADFGGVIYIFDEKTLLERKTGTCVVHRNDNKYIVWYIGTKVSKGYLTNATVPHMYNLGYFAMMPVDIAFVDTMKKIEDLKQYISQIELSEADHTDELVSLRAEADTSRQLMIDIDKTMKSLYGTISTQNRIYEENRKIISETGREILELNKTLKSRDDEITVLKAIHNERLFCTEFTEVPTPHDDTNQKMLSAWMSDITTCDEKHKLYADCAQSIKKFNHKSLLTREDREQRIKERQARLEARRQQRVLNQDSE